MNRNFLTAFCIVALVGLSCPIVAKMACPVDEYFNQELQLVTEPTTIHGEYDWYDDFYFTYVPLDGYITSSDSQGFIVFASVYYSGNVNHLTLSLEWMAVNWIKYQPVPNSSVNAVVSNVWSLAPGYNRYSYRVCATDGERTIYSPVFHFYLNYPYNFVKGGENDEKSEVIDEPKRKEEDIEESETEFSEVSEITE